MENRPAILTGRSETKLESKTARPLKNPEQVILERIRGSGLRNFLFFELQLTAGSYIRARDFIVNSAFARDHGPPLVVSHLNLNNYYRLQEHRPSKIKVGGSLVLIFEGIAMKIGALFLRHEWIPDLNATDLFPMVMEKVSHEVVRLFCLGARRDVVERASLKIREQYGSSCVVECHDGYFGDDEEEEILTQINRSRAHILLLGMGFLKEMDFATRYHHRLKVPLIWNVGGLFDFLSGEKRRAPLFMRRIRLEWFFRLLLEPKRMFHRYVMLAPWWFCHIVSERFRLVSGKK